MFFEDQNHDKIPDPDGDNDDDSTYHPNEDDNDDDDNGGFDGNNKPNKPIDEINPWVPDANGTVNNNGETNEDVPIPDDEGSQGGTSTVTEDDNMTDPKYDNPDDAGIAEGNTEAPEQGAGTVADQPNLETTEPHVHPEL